ncbi:hypothetical protein BKA80DRAFT_256022 [Phyllosticta citrichinensis]
MEKEELERLLSDGRLELDRLRLFSKLFGNRQRHKKERKFWQLMQDQAGEEISNLPTRVRKMTQDVIGESLKPSIQEKQRHHDNIYSNYVETEPQVIEFDGQIKRARFWDGEEDSQDDEEYSQSLERTPPECVAKAWEAVIEEENLDQTYWIHMNHLQIKHFRAALKLRENAANMSRNELRKLVISEKIDELSEDEIDEFLNESVSESDDEDSDSDDSDSSSEEEEESDDDEQSGEDDSDGQTSSQGEEGHNLEQKGRTQKTGAARHLEKLRALHPGLFADDDEYDSDLEIKLEVQDNDTKTTDFHVSGTPPSGGIKRESSDPEEVDPSAKPPRLSGQEKLGSDAFWADLEAHLTQELGDNGLAKEAVGALGIWWKEKQEKSDGAA